LAQSEASFVAKVSITIEEADESGMWIELIMQPEKQLIQGIKEFKSKILKLIIISLYSMAMVYFPSYIAYRLI